MDFKTTTEGAVRRVHREYVGVVACFDRDGTIMPVTVFWKDGRCFPIDEVMEASPFGGMCRGRQTARYRIRFGSHETDLYLEKRAAKPSIGDPETLRWWVYAYDHALCKKGSISQPLPL